MIVVALVACSLLSGAAAQSNATELLHEWVIVEYEWQSPEQMEYYIATGQYAVENNIITGIKVWDGQIYVAVPRWRPGVPSTLNLVGPSGNLIPYPSWEMNQIGRPGSLVYLQSMEIDSRGWMWMLDVGRLNIFGAAPEEIVNGPAKLVIWDIAMNCSIRTYYFPNDVVPYNNSFLNDIVIDETLGFAYISDTWAEGGVIVYDFNHNRSRRFDHSSLHGNPANTITINNITYPVVNPSDGIALTHDGNHLYYSCLSGTELYTVPTALLQNFTMTSQQIGQSVVSVMEKGYSDGLVFGADGRLFYGRLANTAVWQLTANGPEVLYANNVTMQWADTFAFDDNENLYFTTNRLQLYFFHQMKFDGSEGANFRIWRNHVGTLSYMSGNPQPPSMPCAGA